MNVLLILNDGPYGTERSYNGLRLALALAKRDETTVHVFLMADAVGCGKAGQTTPEGYYNLGRMLKSLASRGTAIGACGTCMDARGFTDSELADGIRRSSMAELAEWTATSDRVVTF
ncbi:MAG: DsrE family protein [Chloroflexi bacterium]|nr:DsrE family protein [Chloroflexota bacterium]